MREYLKLPIRTMVGTHGHVFSTDSNLPGPSHRGPGSLPGLDRKLPGAFPAQLEGGSRQADPLLFNGIFWGLRVGIDLWLYRSEDWPAGAALKVGHVLINALFMYLAAAPLALAAWHLLR